MLIGEDHDASDHEIIVNIAEVVENELSLLRRAPLGPSPEQQERWARRPGTGEKESEVGVAGDEDSVLEPCEVEHRFVGRALHRTTGEGEWRRGPLRLASQRQRVRGSDRRGTSRAAAKRQLALTNGLSGVSKRFGNIARLEVRVFSDDLIDGHPIRNHRDHRRDRYAEAANAWLATHQFRVNADSFESHGALLRSPAHAKAVRSFAMSSDA